MTLQDAQYVRTRLETMANANVHGAYNVTMTTDPHLVSKAIFDWWWHFRGNKRKIPPFSSPPTGPAVVTPTGAVIRRQSATGTATSPSGDRSPQLLGWLSMQARARIFDSRSIQQYPVIG